MKFLSYENLLLAYKNARKSRKDKQEVYLFDLNMEEKLFKMLEDIKQRKYIHGKYNKIILVDSKKRYIYSPCFRDHIFHHMMYNCLYNLVDRKLIFSTFACRKGFGSHKAISYMRDKIKKEEKKGKKLYYLKLDISKYFYSINHKILQEKLFSCVQDEDLKYAITIFLESYKTGNIKGMQKFVGKLKKIDVVEDEYIVKRLKNIWESRRGSFDLADFGESYIKKLHFVETFGKKVLS